MAIVAILREPILQGFHLLAQAGYLLALVLDHGVLLAEYHLLLLDAFVSQRQLFPQYLVLFSQRVQFFFNRHARTLLDLTPFGKSPADVGCYKPVTLLGDFCPSFIKTFVWRCYMTVEAYSSKYLTPC